MSSAQEPKLGKLISGKAVRDAVHVAIVPLVAGKDICRGQSFQLKIGDQNTALPAEKVYGQDAIGVVDPFLGDDSYVVKKGQKFWGFLYPGTVTGMVHHWQHPAFDNPVPEPVKKTPINESELWIRGFAQEWNLDYENLIHQASSEGEWRYIVANGIDLHSAEDLGEDGELFWFHLENLLGKKFSRKHRDDFGWSCSC